MRDEEMRDKLMTKVSGEKFNLKQNFILDKEDLVSAWLDLCYFKDYDQVSASHWLEWLKWVCRAVAGWLVSWLGGFLLKDD